MSAIPRETLKLGTVRFDVTTGSLTGADADSLSLRPRSLAVLTALAANEGEVVTKDALIASAWGSTVVTDDSLTQCIADIRRTIGDGDHRIIQTVPTVGYKLLASKPTTLLPSRRRLTVTRGFIVAAVVIVALAGLSIYIFKPVSTPSNPSIAVLPFEILGNDTSQAYFTDGISRAITTNLSRFDGLFVVSSFSAFKYRSSDKALDQIAGGLGVRYLLSGDVQPGQETILINAQLTDTRDGKTVWAEHYSAPRTGVFELQEDLSSRIAATLVERVETVTSQWARSNSTEALTAYELALRMEPAPIDRAGLQEAIELLDQAIALRADFTFAHALRAKNYLLLWRHSLAVNLDQALQEARASAARAIGLDNNSYQAYLVLSQLDLYADQDHAQALANITKALTINPNEADLMVLMATLLGFMNRDEEALEWIEKSYRHNPLHPVWYHWNAAFVYTVSGKNEQAIVAGKKALAVYHSSASIRRILIAAHAQLEQWDKARAYAAEIVELFPDFKLSTHMRNSPFQDPVEKEHFWQLFRKAGLPDGVPG